MIRHSASLLIAALLAAVPFASCAGRGPASAAAVQDGLRAELSGDHFQLLRDGTVFASGRLDGVDAGAMARVEAVADPVFGPGRALRAARFDGGVASIEVYPGLPFAVIRQTVRNDSGEELDLRHAVPATFTVGIGGRKAGELVTMGTAGLKPAAKNPGSYLFQTVVDPSSREGVVAGWLTHERGDGVFFTPVERKDGTLSIKAQIDYGHLRLAPGRSETLETLLVGSFADARLGQEAFADAMKKQHRIVLKPQRSGYCTWYSEVGGLTDPKGGAGASNEKDIVRLAEFAARELKPYGFDFVQIDDEWQDGAANPDGSRINGPRRGFTRHKPGGPYSSGMAPTAAQIKAQGLTAGLWFLPFAANHQDQDFPKDWFMNRRDGMPYETVWGGTSLDLTRPEVQDYLRKLAITIRSWGYDYFKMDGLWTGACAEQVYVNDGYVDDDLGNNQPFFKRDATNIEALRLGLRTLREGAGPEVFFSGCCASQNMRSLGGVIGLVDSMRIGPDNGFGWQDWKNETMHFEGGGIITGPIRANRLYFLHGRVWWNDPDPAYVRPTVKLEHARLLASWVAVSGQFNLNSDWLPGLPAERLEILKRCLPSHSCQARPVDYFDSPMPRIWRLAQEERQVFGLYNWESQPSTIACGAAKAGLKPEATYHAFDFWGGRPLPDFKGEFKFELPKESCLIIAAREALGRPVLVSTSRHVTQGVVDVHGEAFRDGVLSGVSRLVGGDATELRIAGLKDGKGWKLARAEAEGASLEVLPAEEGWLRLRLFSPANREVKWSVKFE
ncbi:MAG: hypothetical protein RL095_3243 [Verrucomicrobiota bacterium]|jgi:hypothetical protein